MKNLEILGLGSVLYRLESDSDSSNQKIWIPSHFRFLEPRPSRGIKTWSLLAIRIQLKSNSDKKFQRGT